MVLTFWSAYENGHVPKLSYFLVMVLTPILPSKNADMAKEHLFGSANLENDINMS